MRGSGPKFTYANVVSTVCLFVTLGGVSWAAATIPYDSVGSLQIKDGSILTTDLAPATLTSISGSRILSGAIVPIGGSNGDMFFRTDTSVLYGPKRAGRWPTTGTSLKGETGATGAVGSKGNAGAAGSTGARGATGVAGAIGAKGDTGATGATGAIGPKGDTGSTGAVGAKGNAGAAGARGATGATGAIGLKGDTGAAGLNGEVGPAGPKGDVGPAGEAGPKGDVGEAGPVGLQGDAGAAGEAGPQGGAGAAGEVGPKGDTGAAGAVPDGIQEQFAALEAKVNLNLSNSLTYETLQNFNLVGQFSYIDRAQKDLQDQVDANRKEAQDMLWTTGMGLNVFAQGLSTRIDSLSTTVDSHTSQLGSINDTLGALNGRIPGFNARGDWAAENTYAIGDLVSLNGSSYVATSAHDPSTDDPTSLQGWQFIASQGDTGAAGQKGDAGEAGPAGPQGDVGPAGEAGAKGDTGEAGAAGPQGDAGPAGEAGAKGDTGESGVLSGVTSERLAALEAQVNLNLSSTMEFATGLQTQLASQGVAIWYLTRTTDGLFNAISDEIYNRQQQMEGMTSTTDNQVQSVNQRINGLSNTTYDAVQSINQRINSLNTTVDSHTTALGSIDSTLADLEAQVNLNLSTTMEFATGLQTQLASQGDDINYLKNLSDLTEEALRNLQDSFWDEIDNRNQLIQDVRSVLYSHTAELQNLHENIGSLWAEINLLWSLLFSPSGPN